MEASLGTMVEIATRVRDYLNIIAEQLSFYRVSVFLIGNSVFEQDNASYLNSLIVQEWF